MAQIKIELSAPPADGMDIKFKAPCDCTAVTGILAVYPEGSQEFTFRDAHGINLAGYGNLFSAGAYVKVIVDTARGYAYIQNADTNGYLESKTKTFTATILASGWYDNASVVEYTLRIDGILPTDEPIMDMAYPSHSLEYMPELIAVEEEFAKIYFAVTGQDTMWIRAKDRPEKDIPIKIKVVR